MTRRQAVLVYILLFYTAAIETAITALVPTYTARFGLSKLDVGVLVGSPNVAVLLLSVPAGLFADRLGNGTLTVCAALLETLAALGQGFAPDFPLLCASWALFGVGVAIVVTASLAWLSQGEVPARRMARLSGSTAVGGAGLVFGPLFGGTAVAQFGLGASFIVAAVLVGGLSLVLIISGFGEATRPARQSLRTAWSLYRGDHRLRAGVALALLLAATSATINVLVPLRLHANGASSSMIGFVFSTAAIAFVAVSLTVTRLGERIERIRTLTVAAFLLSAVFAIPIVSVATVAVVGFVWLRAPLWAIVSTMTYPLSAEGAHHVKMSHSTNFGVLNVAWGLAATAVPPLVGGLAQAIGDRWAYLPALCLAAAAGCWLYAAPRPNVSADADPSLRA